MVSQNEIKKIWEEKKEEIESRLKEFRSIWREGSEEEIFSELSFCLLTPQSKATVCWRAIEKLRDSGVLFFGNAEDIVDFLQGVRFKYTKAENIVKARNFFTKEGEIKIKEIISDFDSPVDMRYFLVRNIRGMGYKEASHFLRNVGFGKDIAILDRHILKSLVELNIIEKVPKGLTRKKYIDIENKMRDFSEAIGIPLDHLDLILWYRKTGKIFK